MRVLISLAWQEPQPAKDNPNFNTVTKTSLKPSKVRRKKRSQFVRSKRKLPHDLYEQADLDMPRAERSGTAYEMPY